MEPSGNVERVLEWLRELTRFGVRPGLERMQWMLDRLGRPQEGLRFLHVAGTNGKGSTCAFLASVFRAAGYRVGLFISPPVRGERERISVDGVPVSEEELAAYAERLRPLLDGMARETSFGEATAFEVWTLLAILHFQRTAPDVVVWETGLGGRLDSTNVVTPELSLITAVGLDHQDVLGGDIEQIAREKAGIIKRGIPVFTSARGTAARIVEESALAAGSPVWRLDRDFGFRNRRLLPPRRHRFFPEGQEFDWVGGEEVLSGCRIALLGAFQCENASLAVAAARYLDRSGRLSVPLQAVYRGLWAARWPGRIEVVEAEPPVVLDGAHNGDAARRLAESLGELSPRPWGIVLGVLRDKDVEAVVDALAPQAAWVVATAPRSERALDPQELAQIVRKAGLPVEVASGVREALDRARLRAGPAGAVCCTGSLYTVAEARAVLKTGASIR